MNKLFSLNQILGRFRQARAEGPTDHASTFRFGVTEIEGQWQEFAGYWCQYQAQEQLLDSINSLIIVLNSARQIIFANRAFLVLINSSLEEVRGLRVGEAVGCKYALQADEGCGTCTQCRQCPAVNGMLNAFAREKTENEACTILTQNNDALELEINYSPVTIGAQKFLICTAHDIHEKNHREMLERTTLHDIQNSVGALTVFSDELLQLVHETANPRLLQISKMIHHVGLIATDELQSHRYLVGIEHENFSLQLSIINLDDFMREVTDLYSTFPWARHCYFIKAPKLHDLELTSDSTLLKRILSNMLKNAAEAEVGKDKPPITVSWGEEKDHVFIAVHNQSAIPEAIKLQLFRKYHSTKGRGRGVGTFSIKVLTERYLKGEVLVDSHHDQGTTFKILLPKKLK